MPFVDEHQAGHRSGNADGFVTVRRCPFDDVAAGVEATNGLDIMSIRSLRDLLRGLRQAGKCILFSTHVMQEVAALCDTVVIIGHGRVVASGSGVELMSRTGRASLEDAFVSLLGSGEGLAA